MRFRLLCFILFLSFTGFAQIPYGNEWINKDQQYLKVKVTEKGIYRITYDQLQAAGFLSATQNPKNFQLFYLGKEVPIYVNGELDNSFDNNDYVEFYGDLENGKADEILYKAGEQPNPEVSLFSDEAVYFLTYNANLQGKRYQEPNLSSSGLTPENYMVYTSSGNFAEQYYPGLYVLDVMTYSDYIEGEGYLGQAYSQGTSQQRILNTPNKLASSTFIPTLDFYVAGRSNALTTNISGFNHHLKVDIGNTTIKDTLFKAYKTIRSKTNINTTDIGNTTTINFSSVNDIGANADLQAASYARITYARSFDVAGANFINFKLNSQNPQCLLSFSNTNNAVIYDPENANRYNGVVAGNSQNFTIDNPQNHELIFAKTNAYKTPLFEKITFNKIDAENFNAQMLLITHSSLINSVNELANYKNSKGISTFMVTVDELYNQFFYGIHHPLAIRNFARYILNNANIKPNYLFLIGKGYELSKQNLTQDLLPTMGFPPSDIAFTSAIIDNNLAPALATGRLSAKTNEEVLNYLDKIKLYDQQPNDIWRKNMINITGGGNNSEDASFANYLKNLSNIAENEYFGSKTTTYYKSVTDPITDNLTAKINTSIETGASLLTFLGHGSTISTAVSIGNPNDINNRNKLLFYYINGCSTGNAFAPTSLGENYIFQKEKGAIAWLGTSSEGVASYLMGVANLFYQNSFKNNYGKSVAQNLASSIRSYQNPNDALNKIHCQQFIYLGDPSERFYSPDKPDYEVNSQSISIAEKNITANSPHFNLMIIVKNTGKAITNDLAIKVKRTLSDNTTIDYPIKTYSNIFNTDTLYFPIDNDIINATGSNKFTIYVDPANSISELNEQNNDTDFTYFFPSNGITLIFPNNKSIIYKENPEFLIEANKLFTKNASYIFELDTVKTFNSDWKKNSGIISGGLFAKWQPSAILENNKIYYWRAKLNVDIQDGGQWQIGSFTYINNDNEGWNEGHYQQFDELELNNIVLNKNNHQFEYTKTAYPIYVQTRGNNSTSNSERRIRVSVSVGALSFNSSDFQGFSIAAFDTINSRKLYNYPSQFNFKNDGINGTGGFFFNTNNPSEVDSLVNYINNIPNGYYVIGLSGINFSGKSLSPAAKLAFQALGLISLDKIENGQPYIFYSRKGDIKNPIEVTADYNSSVLPEEQAITLNVDLLNAWNEGYYLSDKIGPAEKWEKAVFNIEKEPNDLVSKNVIGVESNGKETTLFTDFTENTIDLSNIDSQQYPFIRLKSTVSDNMDFTAAKLKSWKVNYQSYPEISINPEFSNDFYANELNEGDSLKLSLGLSNIKNHVSDSVIVKYTFTKGDRSSVNGIITKTDSLKAYQNQSINFAYPTIGFSGDNILQIVVEPKNGKDLLDFNDVISYPFKVISDNKTPLVDLLFDGKHIINGETVSPNPVITASIVDENKYLLINDTTALEVYLKKQEVSDYQRISFSSNKITLTQTGNIQNNDAQFIIQPGLLEDGIYSLKISAKDKSGNKTNNDLLTDFEVVNEQTITNFLPYPNPVTNSAQFVFKVTGQKVPDKIKIQIMTVSGKIVREINKDELGNINIGNNISTFKWDGTDMYGDRLANGVYFYQVFVENNDGSSIKRKLNATDAMFKKNFGKIYLMK